MDHRVGEFLVSTYVSKPIAHSETFDTHHALFIAESRPSYWLPRVIHTFRQHHPTWPLYLIGTPDVFRLVLTTLGPDGIIPLPFPAPSSPTEYSQLMMSTQLWNSIEHDHVLVCQLDTICLRSVPALYDDYAMVGAVCGHVQLPGEDTRHYSPTWTYPSPTTHDPSWTIQGGLSYRNVHAMRRATHALRPEERHLPEDIAFTRVLRRLDECLPPLETCLDFAIEAFGNPHTAIGLHGVDKLYVPAALIAAALPPSSTKRPLFYIITLNTQTSSSSLWLHTTLFRHIADRFYAIGEPIDGFNNITWVSPGHTPDFPNVPSAIVLRTDLETIPDPAILLDTIPNVTAPVRLAGESDDTPCTLAPIDAMATPPAITLSHAVLQRQQRWVTALLAIQKNISLN